MSSPIALITGGNKGLGYETARRLGGAGYAVLVGARDAGRGEAAAARLAEGGVDARFVQLDVTSAESVRAAAAWVTQHVGRLDVLVNNAGVALEAAGVTTADPELMARTFDINVFGQVRVTQAFLPLLRQSPAGRIVNVSSGLGSLAQNADPSWAFAAVKPASYNASKAAFNMLTVILAAELAGTAIKVNAADPGYTATDLNQNMGTQTVAEGTDAIVRLATLGADGPTGGYFDRHGVVPW
jgi:NAD(P)-dependent dehydrogenase (short-subunit alcohol dehydrogenase family)